MRWSYVKGASGYLLVADGTRRATFEKALALEEGVRQAVGSLPFVFVLNKADLVASWEIDSGIEKQLAAQGLGSDARQREDGRKRGCGIPEIDRKIARCMMSSLTTELLQSLGYALCEDRGGPQICAAV